MRSLLELIKQLFAAGTSCDDVLEVVMPASLLRAYTPSNANLPSRVWSWSFLRAAKNRAADLTSVIGGPPPQRLNDGRTSPMIISRRHKGGP
jgi:hypothetical protein